MTIALSLGRRTDMILLSHSLSHTLTDVFICSLLFAFTQNTLKGGL